MERIIKDNIWKFGTKLKRKSKNKGSPDPDPVPEETARAERAAASLPRINSAPKRQLSKTISLPKQKLSSRSQQLQEKAENVGGDAEQAQAEDGSGNWQNDYESAKAEKARQDQENQLQIRDTGIHVAPDGGYGWVIVFVSFLCNVIVDGIVSTFGVFLPHVAKSLHQEKGTVAWVGSLLAGVYLGCGSISSALTHRFGCRKVCIAGAFIGAAAFGLSSLATSIGALMLLYGVVGGFGLGLVYLPAVVCVGYYFHTKRALATGIAVCGSGVGTFAFAPLASFLLRHMDWRSANLIYAGIVLSTALCGLAMKPLALKSSEDEDVRSYGGDSGRLKPSLHRLAEEAKRNYTERISMAGSRHYVVKRADGTMEKIQLNEDSGVDSTSKVNPLAFGTRMTPVSSKPVLPTITEEKTIKTENTSAGSKNGIEEGSQDPDKKAKEDYNANTEDNNNNYLPNIPEPSKPSMMPTRVESRIGSQSQLGNKSVVGGIMSRNGSTSQFNHGSRSSIPKKISVPFFDEQERKGSFASMIKEPIAGFMGSVIVNPASVEENHNTENTQWTQAKFSDALIKSSSKKSMITVQHKSQHSVVVPRESPENGGGGEEGSCKQELAEMIDCSLLKDPVFVLIAFETLFGMLGFYVPFTFLVDVAVMKGVPADSAALLLSMIGVSNTIGRIAAGIISDIPGVNALFVNNIFMFVSSFCVLCVPFCGSIYFAYVAVAVGYGFFISAFISLASIILAELLGVTKMMHSFGMVVGLRGVAGAVGAPLAGALYDKFKSYDLPFYLAGTFLFCSGVSSSLIPFVVRYTRKPEQAEFIANDEQELETDKKERQSRILAVSA